MLALSRQVGGRIRQAREDAHVTQSHLASKLGVTFQAVQRLERGDLTGLDRLEIIATLLGVQYEWLLTGRWEPANVLTPTAVAKIMPEVGFYSRQPQIGTTVHSDVEVRRIIGLAPDSHLDFNDWLKCVHKDDAARIDAELARCLNPRGDGIFWAEYTLIGRDGVERRIMDLSRTTFDKAKRAILRIGWMRDITRMKTTDNEKKRAVNALQDALRIYDRSRKFIAATVAGLGASELIDNCQALF